MASYTSLNAYKIAVKLRTSRTILVEGDSDALVIKRLLLEEHQKEQGRSHPTIDTPAIVTDVTLIGLNNKAIVYQVARSLAAEHPSFVGLIDNEWDGFSLETFEHSASNEEIPVTCKVTKGHSIENYFFEYPILVAYLKRRHVEVISAQMLAELEKVFGAIQKFAFAYSITIGRRQLISKCNDVLCHESIAYDANSFDLNGIFRDRLIARGVEEDVADETIQTFRAILLKVDSSVSLETRKWMAHGHLGQNAIWACIGALAVKHGAPAGALTEISRGARKEKMKDGAHVLATGTFYSSPLSDIAKWGIALKEI